MSMGMHSGKCKPKKAAGKWLGVASRLGRCQRGHLCHEGSWGGPLMWPGSRVEDGTHRLTEDTPWVTENGPESGWGGDH